MLHDFCFHSREESHIPTSSTGNQNPLCPKKIRSFFSFSARKMCHTQQRSNRLHEKSEQISFHYEILLLHKCTLNQASYTLSYRKGQEMCKPRGLKWPVGICYSKNDILLNCKTIYSLSHLLCMFLKFEMKTHHADLSYQSTICIPQTDLGDDVTIVRNFKEKIQ